MKHLLVIAVKGLLTTAPTLKAEKLDSLSIKVQLARAIELYSRLCPVPSGCYTVSHIQPLRSR